MLRYVKRAARQTEMDRAIVGALEEDGRLSNRDLAQRVHLAPSACLRWVKRLKDAGVIAGYVADGGSCKNTRASAPSAAHSRICRRLRMPRFS